MYFSENLANTKLQKEEAPGQAKPTNRWGAHFDESAP